MNLLRVILCLALLLPLSSGAQPRGAAPWGIGWTQSPAIVVLGFETDPRVGLVREAVDFWNRTLAELGTPFRLASVTPAGGTIPVEELRGLSEGILNRTGLPGFPEAARALPGDLIVVLSEGEFVSFAARWPSSGKALVGIRTQRTPPLSLPNVARNLIAHELGHAIGLGHNADPAMLMCGRPAPCRPDAFFSRTERFFPLTEGDRAELLRMYPADWTPR
jgi:hypothetical protein